jgi:hypothetical protein
MRLAIKRFRKPLFALILVLSVVLSATGHLDTLLNTCGLASISKSNSQYLKESFDESVKGFIVLSAIKSGVAVLEGSEVGMGFNLEVGDIIQSIYDYVDVAWRTALAGGTILLLMQLVLQTIQLVDHWFLFSAFAMALLLCLLGWIFPSQKKLYRILKEFFLFLTVLSIGLYFILPVSISGAAFLSSKITRPLVTEARSGFESLQSDLRPEALNERLFPEDNQEDSLWSRLDFMEKLDKSKTAIVKMMKWIDEITHDFATWTIKLIAGYLFDCVVFPLAFFVVVYILTRSLLTYVFGFSRSQTFREDFDAVLKKYYAGRPAVIEE